MTNDDKQKLYRALSAPFTEDAIERTEGRVTGRGYDTTGIKYQYIVNRLNEVLGLGSHRTQQKIDVKTYTNAKGRIVYDATCEITLQIGEWTGGQFNVFAEGFAVGGHTSMSEADAKKGGFTNGFKKAAAMLGCGKQAYEGTLDDDNVPAGDLSAPPDSQRINAPAGRPASTRQSRQEASHDAPPTHAPQTQPMHRLTEASPESRNGGQPPTGAQSGNARNRLTTKQLSAIWALAKKLNYGQQEFRQQVKRRFNVQPEFLDRNAASTIIGELSARASNGVSHPAGEHAAVA